MYKVIKHFVDLQDNNFEYKAGDIFPRPGLVVTEERFTELAGSVNKQGVPLIQLMEEAPKKKKAKKTADK